MVTRVADLRADNRPIDKDVKIPEAVKRAAAAAEAAQAAAYPGQPPADAPPAPPAAGDTIVIAEPQPAPPAPAPQPAPAPAVTPQGNEPPAPQPAADLVQISADELQKLRSLAGRTPHLTQQIAQANDRMAILESTIQDLQTQRLPPAPPPAPTRLVTPEEESNFGTEMLDVMGRRATEAISPALAELRAMVQGLESKVTGTQTALVQSAKQKMLSDLDRELPEWRQINTTDGFKAWLSLTDPLFGISRQSALLKAYEQNDTSRVLKFFQGFVSELAASTPANDLPANPSPAPAPARPSLDSLAAPGRARMSAQPNAPAEKQIITTADVNAFYEAVRRGMYRGREPEKDALEQELFAAQREGRVRPA